MMTEVISSALNFMRLPFDQSLAELFESVPDRGVVDVVADLDAQPADQAGVDLEPDDGCRGEHPGEAVAQGALLPLVEGDRRPDEDRPAVLPAVPDRPGLAGDRAQQAEPAVAVEHAEEAGDDRQGSPLEDLHQ